MTFSVREEREADGLSLHEPAPQPLAAILLLTGAKMRRYPITRSPQYSSKYERAMPREVVAW
jgi:hypothetical protein